MTDLPLVAIFAVNAIVVAAVSTLARRGVSTRLNLLLSSAYLTVPVFVYTPLADVGVLFVFDMVVPAVALQQVRSNRFRLTIRPIASIGYLVLVFPLVFAPLAYFVLDPAYFAFHTVTLTLLLYRCLLIFLAASVLVADLKSARLEPVIRLMAMQSLALFALGALQYVGGVDLVVYERFKDTENIFTRLLMEGDSVMWGVGFLGLFRGAVPQMAILGIFWWLLYSKLNGVAGSRSVGALLMCFVGLICTVGSLSRIGVIAVLLVMFYAALMNRRLLAGLATSGLLLLPLAWPYLAPLFSDDVIVAMVLERFDLAQFTGSAGSGVTRIHSVLALAAALGTDWTLWVIGMGGYNPIATAERFGVFGMHGDYLDIMVRYGVLIGLCYLLTMIVLLIRQLVCFFSRDATRRNLSRAFGVVAIGLGVLAMTQGALLFSGAAGYLAAAQGWLAIAFALMVRRRVLPRNATYGPTDT